MPSGWGDGTGPDNSWAARAVADLGTVGWMARTPVTGRAGGAVATVTIAVLTLAWLVDYVDRAVLPLALPAISGELRIDTEAAGLVLTVYYFLYAVCQIPGGMVADRCGARPTMVLALVACSVTTALNALVHGYVGLVVVRALFAVSIAAVPGATMKMLAERVRPNRRLTANGIMFGTTLAGGAMAPLIAAPVVEHAGWRSAFLLVAAVGMLGVPMVWLVLPRALPEQEMGAGPARWQRPGRFVTCGALWQCALLTGGMDFVGYGILSWLPTYLISVRHVGITATGALVTVPRVASAVAVLAGGMLFDRFAHLPLRRLVVPPLVVSGIFLAGTTLVDGAAPFVTLLTLSMAAQGLAVMPVFGLPLRLVPIGYIGTVISLINCGAQLGGSISPYVMGLLATRFSFSVAFGFLLVGTALTIAGGLWIPQTEAEFRRRVLRTGSVTGER
jgi:MFS family permease